MGGGLIGGDEPMPRIPDSREKSCLAKRSQFWWMARHARGLESGVDFEAEAKRLRELGLDRLAEQAMGIYEGSPGRRAELELERRLIAESARASRRARGRDLDHRVSDRGSDRDRGSRTRWDSRRVTGESPGTGPKGVLAARAPAFLSAALGWWKGRARYNVGRAEPGHLGRKDEAALP